jgi:hypothetical protein
VVTRLSETPYTRARSADKQKTRHHASPEIIGVEIIEVFFSLPERGSESGGPKPEASIYSPAAVLAF